ncbi:MAG TPA: pentapeptide repeat-containing protein [Cyclobacteriaceae bacterium]|nr:pentapeptide repeat-containing protein [Cyclobacteriaceae bacterium]
MKPTVFVLSFLLITTAALAQTKVSASEIIKKINAGQSVAYSNVQIEGDLDLTDLHNRRPEHQTTSWFGSDDETFESQVEVTISFTNCTFLGDVLAYYNVEREHATYIAHFEKDVTFTNCTFDRAAEFKYSEFKSGANFSGSTFNEEANFKYSEFSDGPKFANVKFEHGADFKYTEFPRETSFEKATFRGLANFKYSQFRSPVNLDGVDFRGSEDFKYTEIDGRSFTSYLLHKGR